MKRIQVNEPGGPENLQLVDVPTPRPGPKEALVRIVASGVNFIDVYFRSGLYKADLRSLWAAKAPASWKPSARKSQKSSPAIAWPTPWRAAPMPNTPWFRPALSSRFRDHVDFDTAAAAMLQGMTAHYLTHSVFPLKEGDSCLVHAAAGGAGGLIVQMAKMKGARVFGTVSTEEKAAIAREHGADEAILYTEQDFEAEVKRLTGGRGVDVVYDSVGKTTFEKSLNSLRPRGTMALFGQSSGPVPPFDPNILNGKGSLFLTRPSLGHYVLTRDELLWRAGDVLGWIASGSSSFASIASTRSPKRPRRIATWKAAGPPAS